MKTLFLKNGMPVATAVLAIAGAFATTSMQSSSSNFELVDGYAPNGVCNIAVSCSNEPSNMVCRVSYPAGQRAFELDPILGSCYTTLWKPF